MAATGEITHLLHRWRDGDREAEDELFSKVFPHLRRLAHYLMRGERKGHSRQATELIGEAYFSLVAARDREWQNRAHFFAIAGRVMRRHLIDHARGRPPAQFVSLEGIQNLLPSSRAELDLVIRVDRLLDQLASTNPEWCTLVELKYFLGMTDEEASEALGMKLRSMQRMWLDVRKWLFEQTDDPHHGAHSAGR
jgi:RNA polymerase sigma factor (TIGR02999 family)